MPNTLESTVDSKMSYLMELAIHVRNIEEAIEITLLAQFYMYILPGIILMQVTVHL